MPEIYHLLIGLLTFAIAAYWLRDIRQRFQDNLEGLNGGCYDGGNKECWFKELYNLYNIQRPLFLDPPALYRSICIVTFLHSCIQYCFSLSLNNP